MSSRRSPGRQHETVLGVDSISLAPHGSLSIDEEQLAAAFEFFDVEKTGKLTAAGMKQRLGAFYKNLPSKEIKLLLGDGAFTKETLRSLLTDNQLGAYDPMAEAFKAYDPNGTGFIDTETLRGIFESLGYGEINDDDLKVLVETADVDRDGRISLEDFRQMLSKVPAPGPAPAAAWEPEPAASPPAPADEPMQPLEAPAAVQEPGPMASPGPSAVEEPQKKEDAPAAAVEEPQKPPPIAAIAPTADHAPPSAAEAVPEVPPAAAPPKKRKKTQAERMAEMSAPRIRDDRIKPGCHVYKPPVRGLAYRGTEKMAMFQERRDGGMTYKHREGNEDGEVKLRLRETHGNEKLVLKDGETEGVARQRAIESASGIRKSNSNASAASSCSSAAGPSAPSRPGKRKPTHAAGSKVKR